MFKTPYKLRDMDRYSNRMVGYQEGRGRGSGVDEAP
jgi:hypothetical protein